MEVFVMACDVLKFHIQVPKKLYEILNLNKILAIKTHPMVPTKLEIYSPQTLISIYIVAHSGWALINETFTSINETVLVSLLFGWIYK